MIEILERWCLITELIEFFVQGDVESIASKNPKELTGLLEQISGSDELKRDYEQFEEEKAAAEEKSALVYQKKKTVVMERKQKKEQKEEAEKHLRLQDQLVRMSVSVYFCFVHSVYPWKGSFQSFNLM